MKKNVITLILFIFPLYCCDKNSEQNIKYDIAEAMTRYEMQHCAKNEAMKHSPTHYVLGSKKIDPDNIFLSKFTDVKIPILIWSGLRSRLMKKSGELIGPVYIYADIDSIVIDHTQHLATIKGTCYAAGSGTKNEYNIVLKKNIWTVNEIKRLSTIY
jgi:hypothetical protein